ncbi:MAG: glycoside hydrolase family 2 TIM barrel-domain containing protein [Eubacteriales bacterium]|nr:glycoside hydrolase family 2 TIM barrel-domain containing protein [Eubacteriales bacterium]
MAGIPRAEHPLPQWERESWRNLNGEWDFAFDFGKSGIDRAFYEKKDWEQKILVPFCPESCLSGIGYKDFIPAVWYHRTEELTKGQLTGRVLLHFGAVDYACRVWVNGKPAGSHRGGYTSFTLDITALCREGENDLTVYAEDDTRSGRQPRGKQSGLFYSHGCDYTRTTGIWQTVWLEFVPENYVKSARFYPNIEEGTLTVEAQTAGNGVLCAKAFYEGKECGQASVRTSGRNAVLTVRLSELHLWEAGDGQLYDLELSFGEDRVRSYFGMRSLELDGERFLINGKSVFQRLVLDQGFYPDGIYTAPSDEALEQDIRLSMAAGFNGARLHQKVFEPRFLYHCDRLGYLVWGEQGNWGLDVSAPDGLKHFLPEWMEAVERDFNHPAIVGWCPFNETWDYEGRRQDNDLLEIVYRMTRQYDTTRPCIDTSGNYHVVTDIYDLHDYEQDPAVFEEHYRSFAEGGALRDNHSERQTPVEGVPVFISEYGGIKWDVDKNSADSWGYGNGPQTEEEFISRYRGLTDALLDNPRMFGFCYTQLYDVEQEVNGLYTYGRKPKFDMEIFKKINGRKAAIEE